MVPTKKSTKVAPEGTREATSSNNVLRNGFSKASKSMRNLANDGVTIVQRHSETLRTGLAHSEETEIEQMMGDSGMFHEAAEHGDLKQVETYMKQGKDKDEKPSKLVMLSKDAEDHRNALHKACLNGHKEIVKQLLKDNFIKEGVNIRDRYGCTALNLACVKARHTRQNGARMSHKITQWDKLEIIRDLLRAGADPIKAWTHHVGAKGSCFHWCAAHGFPMLLEVMTAETEEHPRVSLESTRTLVMQLDSRARIPLDIAGSIYLKMRFEYEENLPKVNDILERIGLQVDGAVTDDVLEEEKETKKTGISERKRSSSSIRRSGTIREAHDGSLAVIYHEARGHGMNIVEKQLMNREQTVVAIISAVNLDHEEELAEKGKANVHLLQSMLSWCSFIGLKSKVEQLIRIAQKKHVGMSLSWAKIHSQNGRTALHFAAIMGRNTIIEMLLDFYGEDESKSSFSFASCCCCFTRPNSSLSLALNQPDYFGNTPLHLCAMQTNYPVYFGATGDTASILLKHGADARILNAVGRSPANYVRGDCEQEFRNKTHEQTFFNTKESCYDDKAVRDPTKLSFDWVIRFRKKKNPRCGPWIRTLFGDDCCSCCCRASKKGDTLIKQAKEHRKDLENYLRSPDQSLVVFSKDTDEDSLLLITATEKTLLKHADILKIELPVLRQRLQEVYQPARHFVFEPLRSRERVRIIKAIVDNKMNLEVYKKSGIILDYFPMHEENELEVVNRRWSRGCCPEPFRSPWDLLDENRSSLMAGLTILGGYFGEEIAMYFGFLSFYTLFLGYFLMIPGALVASYQLYNVAANGLDKDSLNSPFIPLFAGYLAVWCTILVEKWKRKQAELAYRWDTADFVREEHPLTAYWGPERFHPIKREVEKHFPESRRRKRQCIGLIPMIVMIGLVVAVFQGIVHFRKLFSERQTYPMNEILGAVAGIVQGATIAVLNYLYKWIAVAVTNYENYKTQTHYDNALIVKLFLFQFVNGNLALIQAAFVDRDPIRLWTLLILLMTGQQLLDTFKRNVIPRLMFLWRWKAAKKFIVESNFMHGLSSLRAEFVQIRKKERKAEYAEKKGEELVSGVRNLSAANHEEFAHPALQQGMNTGEGIGESKAIQEALRNCAMEDQDSMMIDNYAVIVSQYTYIVLWSVAFPLAPLFAFLVNFMQIRGEVGLYCLSTKRTMPVMEFGIGSWCIIIEIVSLIGVVSNTVMIISTFSSREVFLQYVDESWDLFLQNEYVFMAFIIFLEHGIIALKLSLATIIADKPAWVLEQELIELEEQRCEGEHERDLQLSAQKKAEEPPSAVRWFRSLTTKVHNRNLYREVRSIQTNWEKQRSRAILDQSKRKAQMALRTKKRIEARRAAKLNGALTKCRIFASLPKDAIEKLIDIMEYEKIDGATVVCREGAVADKMYLIVSGECEVFDGGQTVEDTTDDVVIKTLKSNEIFGESALYHGDNEEFVPRRKKTVRVKEGSVLEALVMESVDFHLIKRNGTLNHQTMVLLKQVAQERQQENTKRDEARKSSTY